MSNSADFIIENGVLTEYVGPGGDVVIPEGVKEIGIRAFEDCTNVFKLIIPSGVEEISDQAFLGCEGLTNVEISDGVEIIGWQAFYGCVNLTSITVPDSVWWIKQGAFEDCESLKDENGFVIVNSGVYGYYGPGGEITIPDGVIRIGDGAFEGCSNITGIKIPGTVEEIESSAFHCCSKLTSIHIPSGVVDLGKRVFCFCTSLESVFIPETVTSIGAHVFEGCSRLSHIEILSRDLEDLKFSDLPNDAKIIAPFLPLDTYDCSSAKKSAVLGFLSNPEKYTDPTIADVYGKYATTQRKKLLPVIFAQDLVQALMFYTTNCKITAGNFESEYLLPATNAQATGCIAYLLDWFETHFPKETAN